MLVRVEDLGYRTKMAFHCSDSLGRKLIDHTKKPVSLFFECWLEQVLVCALANLPWIEYGSLFCAHHSRTLSHVFT